MKHFWSKLVRHEIVENLIPFKMSFGGKIYDKVCEKVMLGQSSVDFCLKNPNLETLTFNQILTFLEELLGTKLDQFSYIFIGPFNQILFNFHYFIHTIYKYAIILVCILIRVDISLQLLVLQKIRRKRVTWMHVQVEEATKSRQDQDKYKEGQEKTKRA